MDKTEDQVTHGVFYTDGGCLAKNPKDAASRGFSGWGMHGYIYNEEPCKKGSGSKRGTPTKKGYDTSVPAKKGVNVISYIDAASSIKGEGTNNIGEITAAMQGMMYGMKKGVSSITIITDSKYVVNGNKYLKKWADNNWKKSDNLPIKNLELWQSFKSLKDKIQEEDIKLNFIWVKGHASNQGNVFADKHARRAVLGNKHDKPLDYFKESDAAGYFNIKADYNKLLSLANWYFSLSENTAHTTKEGYSIYYLGDIRTREEFLGKKISDASFAVVYLKQPDPILSRLFEMFQNLTDGSLKGLMVGHLKEITSPTMYENLIAYDDELLLLNEERKAIEHMDKARDQDSTGIELGHEIRPVRLAYKAMNNLEALEVVLDQYLHPKPTTKMTVLDITDKLFDQKESKNVTKWTLKKDIKVSTRFIDVDVDMGKGKKPIRLTLGQDLPYRNTLAKLEGSDTKVSLVMWPESDKAFRFVSVIEYEGNIALHAGPYSNLRLK